MEKEVLDKDLKILYVDDQNSVIQFVKILFEELGLSKITYANNGKEALDLYKKNKQYDIVFTDMMMPEMDGFELIDNIMKIKHEQVIVMVTGMEEKQDLIRAIELEVKYFIEKPIQPKKFFKVFDSAVELFKLKKEHDLSNLLVEQYKEAIDQTTIFTKTNLDGNITYVNDQFCKISQYTPEEILGKPHQLLRHEDMQASEYDVMWKTINEKKIWKGINKNRSKDGSLYIADTTIIPMLDTDNNIIEFIGIRHDITEAEKYKEYLKFELDGTNLVLKENQNMKKQYQKGLDESTAIFRTDTNNLITYVNENFCKISGYTSDELLGVNCSSLRDESHIKKGHCEELKKKLKNKEMVKITFKNISKSSKPFYTDTLVYPIEDIYENTVEHMHVMHDITKIVELNHEIEDTQKEVIYTMGAIGETRSKETGNHVKRVAEYSYLLAKLSGLDDKDAEMIKMASPMHDIGKVGIPDAILNKPARLTEEEFKIMKTHSKLGYNMLKGSNRQLIKASSVIALEHHERWDGKGYPHQLKGEDIHIYGRITAVCDVFDALGSDRCYKKAWELDAILDLFKEEKGKQFDPNLIQLFLDNLEEFLKIRDRYLD